MELTVAEIAERLNAECPEQGDLIINGMAGVRDAAPGQIAFIENPRYNETAATTKASAILVSHDFDFDCDSALIRVDDVQAAFREVINWFAIPQHKPEPGIHETAIVDESASLGEDVHIGPHVVIEAGAVIGDRTILMAGLGIEFAVGI